MFFGSWTKIPLIGRFVRWIANAYGRTQHRAYLLTPAEAAELVSIAEGVARAPCSCRKLYHKCDNPQDNEILLGPTRHIFLEAFPRDSHEITREEALEILNESHRRRLILTILKCRGDFYAICSCCPCCCVPLRLNKQYGIGSVIERHKNIVDEFREYQQWANAHSH
jgi:hypothetical protein